MAAVPPASLALGAALLRAALRGVFVFVFLTLNEVFHG